MDDHIYIIAYDISDTRRWRKIFKLLHGYGDWLQLSIFQCRLSKKSKAELEFRCREIIKAGHDHLLIIDIGSASSVHLRIESIGKSFDTIERAAVII